MADNKQILFSGVSTTLLSGVGTLKIPPKIAELKKPEPSDNPVMVLWNTVREAYIKWLSTNERKQLYGDPDKGATLEQAWRTGGLLTGKFPVVLLSTEQPPVATDAIERVIRMTSKEILDSLIDLFEMGGISFSILYYDGYIGHCITLEGYNKSSLRFTYADSWPGDSLLCKDFNAAGVDAKPNQDGTWSVTYTELEKVICAAFVQPPLWSEYMGEKYYITYSEFMNSDFWTFFNLREVGKRTKGNNTIITLKTGGFQTKIDLNVTINQRNRFEEGLLSVKRSWIIGPPFGLNPFALDVIRSFIIALTPPLDQDTVFKFINMLDQIQDQVYVKQMINEGLEKSKLHQALFTYLGLSPSFEAIFQFSSISMTNQSNEGEDWLHILITIDWLASKLFLNAPSSFSRLLIYYTWILEVFNLKS